MGLVPSFACWVIAAALVVVAAWGVLSANPYRLYDRGARRERMYLAMFIGGYAGAIIFVGLGVAAWPGLTW